MTFHGSPSHMLQPGVPVKVELLGGRPLAPIPSRAQRCNLITVPPANRAAASSPVRDPLLRLALTCPSAPLLWLAGQPLERVIIPKYFYALLSSSFPPLLPFLTFSSHSSLSISLSLLRFIPLLRSSPSSSSSFFRRLLRLLSLFSRSSFNSPPSSLPIL
ncbi:hypothetical protein CBS147346_3871 [Aspergillus niger]|nr:hypothetical protein CBS147346_3871 [Aspergillus niger]